MEQRRGCEGVPQHVRMAMLDLFLNLLVAFRDNDHTERLCRQPRRSASVMSSCRFSSIRQALFAGNDLADTVEVRTSASTSDDKTLKITSCGWAWHRGCQKRHYFLKEADEIMPYCLYAPKAYDGKRGFPLIVALHGNGGTEDTMLPSSNSLMAKLAEQFGYIVASPKGYRPDGGYGGKTEDSWDPLHARASRFSEMDVMSVLRLVREEYRIDDNRIYLMGHSGGGGGTWRLGAKYPDIWAALGPISSAAGGFSPDSLERMRQIPVVVCHGDADSVAPVSASRTLVARMKELGMTHEYYELPGVTHAAVIPSLPHVFEFFNRHRRVATQGKEPQR